VAIVIEAAHPDDLGRVLALLAEAGLPEAGLRDHRDGLLVARIDGELVGCAAVEMYGTRALLRSVAVCPAHRGRGVGRCLTDAALLFARAHEVRDVYLLTTTAQDYFRSLGFEPVDRAAVPAALHASAEFQGACPATAQVMTRVLR
jgi:N-acetylglutamate synthase-like GNAT family acetyltransferase